MALTTIPLQKETRDRLRDIAKKSESWDDLLNRLYKISMEKQAQDIFFSKDSLTAKEAIEYIKKCY
jgi:hypothetical protein